MVSDPCFGVLHLRDGGELYPRLLGDISLDGIISIPDLVLLSRIVAQDEALLDTSASALALADINNDGRLDATDISELSRYLAGLRTL